MTHQPVPDQYDFISGDLFQPEEIFQLDQPIKTDLVGQQADINRSPSTLLDLGSGTIHREFKNEQFWGQNMPTTLNDDSNSSQFNLSQSPGVNLGQQQAHFMEGAKVDELGGTFNNLAKGFMVHTPQNEDYKVNFEMAQAHQPNKLYFDDCYDGYQQKLYTKGGSYQEKYIELGQYGGEYNFFYGGNKSSHSNNNNNNENMFSELDFRINNCIPGVVYNNSHESFDLMTHP